MNLWTQKTWYDSYSLCFSFSGLLTGPGVERVLVPLCRAQEEGGGDEASDHAGADHLGGSDGRRDDDGDEAAAEEAALVERVDEGRPRRGQRQGAAQGDRVTLEMHLDKIQA